MKEGTKLWNKQAKKVAYFQKESEEYVYIKINGLTTPVKKEIFDAIYEVLEG